MGKSFDMAGLFQALGDGTRLRLLSLMREREVCVCYFVEVLGEPQPKISRHLAYLRDAGLVEARREGKWMHYSIAWPEHEGAARVLREALAVMVEERAVKADAARMAKACCAPGRYALEGAPVPAQVGCC